MNTPTIEMERTAALAKLEEYETAAQKNPKLLREIDRDIMEGYRVLAKGRRMVDVNEAIKHGGLNLAGQPKLAIARAHVEATRWRATGSTGTSVFWWHDKPSWWSNRSSNNFRWELKDGYFGDARQNAHSDFQALAPLIPLPHRPKFKLENYFLLWEANWSPVPPIDPYLLRPVVGSMMEIIAEWDVSPIELEAVRSAMRPAR